MDGAVGHGTASQWSPPRISICTGTSPFAGTMNCGSLAHRVTLEMRAYVVRGRSLLARAGGDAEPVTAG